MVPMLTTPYCGETHLCLLPLRRSPLYADSRRREALYLACTPAAFAGHDWCHFPAVHSFDLATHGVGLGQPRAHVSTLRVLSAG